MSFLTPRWDQEDEYDIDFENPRPFNIARWEPAVESYKLESDFVKCEAVEEYRFKSDFVECEDFIFGFEDEVLKLMYDDKIEDDDKTEDDPGRHIPQYAALSYGWGDETEMMATHEINYPRFSSFTSSAILCTDTYCTHKSSSSELGRTLELLCKGDKSKFLRSPTRCLLEKVTRSPNGVRQRCYGFILEARRSLVMKITELLIGDGEIGPQAGQPSMGREDDDDDDCVGFQRFSRLGRNSKMIEDGAQWHTNLDICNFHKHSLCASIPKYGPPKRDPVAAALSGPVKHLLDASTLSIWRDVISRTCGAGADFRCMETKARKGSRWKSGGTGTNCHDQGAGYFLRVH